MNCSPSAAGGRYRFVRRLHAGPRCEVWLASSPTGEAVAVKALRSEYAGQSLAREWLRREHSLLGELSHPHLLQVGDALDLRGSFAFASEYLAGGDMVSLAGGDPRRWLPAARDLLAAIDYLHASGYVHRDVKARNAMFDADDRVRLIDFGSAAEIGTPASVHGVTPAHCRPGFEREPNRPENDLYAFAVLLHEMMYGRLPGPVSSAVPAGAERLGPLQAVVGDVLSIPPLGDTPGSAEFFDAIGSALSDSVNDP